MTMERSVVNSMEFKRKTLLLLKILCSALSTYLVEMPKTPAFAFCIWVASS